MLALYGRFCKIANNILHLDVHYVCCLFGSLSHWIGALQISNIIIIHYNYIVTTSVTKLTVITVTE